MCHISFLKNIFYGVWVHDLYLALFSFIQISQFSHSRGLNKQIFCLLLNLEYDPHDQNFTIFIALFIKCFIKSNHNSAEASNMTDARDVGKLFNFLYYVTDFSYYNYYKLNFRTLHLLHLLILVYTSLHWNAHVWKRQHGAEHILSLRILRYRSNSGSNSCWRRAFLISRKTIHSA